MTQNAGVPPLVLSIAGFDPTSGAGVSADLKTFAANGCYGLACVTAITVQDTHGTRYYQSVAPEQVEGQLTCLFEDVPPRAVKIGMLGSKENIETVVQIIERFKPPIVVLDPVYRATSGARLTDDKGLGVMKQRLLPKVSVITPNLAEAEVLTGITIAKQQDMEEAALALYKMGASAVVITGGHLDKPVDLFYSGGNFVPLVSDRVRTNNTHGAGCAFSAAVAAHLALGKQPADAVVVAKAFVTAALKMSYPIGSGRGPLNHLFRLQGPTPSRNVDPAPQVEYTTR